MRSWKGRERKTMEINEIFEKLDDIQEKMQSEEISLEDSFRYYAEAFETV